MKKTDDEDENMIKSILNKVSGKTDLLEWKEDIYVIMSVSLEKLRRKVQYESPEEGLSERDMRLFSALTKCYIDLSKVDDALNKTINEKISGLDEKQLDVLEKKAAK